MPVGPQFEVSADATNYMNAPSVAMDADGDFVVVWNSGTPFADSDVRGQRYDSAGDPAGSEFQVNTYTTSWQSSPSVAAQADGNFVVVWTSNGSYGSDSSAQSIQGQRYASDGTPLGSQFQVNTYTTNYQFVGNVAAEADGDFVVVWSSRGSFGTDGSGGSIQGQRYASDGTPLGSQFQVNTYTTNAQTFSSVSLDSDGDFVVVFQSFPARILGQRYASDGSPVGGEFLVSTSTTGQHEVPSVSMDADGDFVVVWSVLPVGGDIEILGRRFASDGTPGSGEFQVNARATTDWQRRAHVAMEGDGDFVVVWSSYHFELPFGPTSDNRIEARRYGSDGTAVGSEFQVNAYTTNFQPSPQVAGNGHGGFVIAWDSAFQETEYQYPYGYVSTFSDFSIRGQRLVEVAECADGLDNDSDGYTDAGFDPGCTDAADASEQEASQPCDDGLDNEIPPDGFVDAADPGCGGDPTWPLEDPACQNGIDDDGDGGTDHDGGSSAGNPTGVPDPHCAGKAWRNKEVAGACGLGIEVALVLVPLLLARRLRVGGRSVGRRRSLGTLPG